MLSLPDYKEKSILIIYAKDYHLKFANENLVLEDKKQGKIINQVSCHKLFVVMIIGSNTFSSGLLEKAQKYAFSLIFLKDNFNTYASLGSYTEGNVILRKQQYKLEESHTIAQHLVYNKIASQLANLKQIRQKTPKLKTVIKRIQELQALAMLKETQTNEQLLGIEGNVSQLYFNQYFAELEWKARRPRTRFDSLNTVLDSGYTMLFNFIEAHLRIYGFDLYQGVYHRVFYQRKSLVCDLVEPFRPLIDIAMRNAFNLKQFQESDFEIRNNQYEIKIKERRKFTKVFAQALLAEKEAIFTYIQLYYRAFIRAKHISNYPHYNLCLSSVTTSLTTNLEPDLVNISNNTEEDSNTQSTK